MGGSPRGGRGGFAGGKGPLRFWSIFSQKRGSKKSSKNRPPFRAFFGTQNSLKIDPRPIFEGSRTGSKKGSPSRVPKSEILLLFITLRQGPGSPKGAPFRDR